MRDNRIRLLLDRSSVCMADDVVNHEQTLEVASEDSLRDVLEKVQVSGYLPAISGGHATWIVQAGRPLAVVAQQWTSAKCVIPENSPIEEILGEETSLYFNYWMQSDPEVVFECLKNETTLPNPYEPSEAGTQ